MRPLGLSRGSIRLVRTVSNGGRSARTRFRCTKHFTSRGCGQALTLVRGIGILELLGLCGGTTRLPGRATQVSQGPLGPGKMGSQDHLRPGGAVRETEHLLRGPVNGIGGLRLPSRLLAWLLIDPAGSMPRQGNVSMAEIADSSMRGILPSTPRTGDRPVRDKPMYFGYCYDWMYGKCTAQQCKYLHQKPPPGTKPITPRTTAGPVVEDEEGTYAQSSR